MRHKIHSHRFANLVVQTESFKDDFDDLINTISDISDDDLIDYFTRDKAVRPSTKSLSKSINNLLKDKLESLNWNSESPIFKEEEYTINNKSYWRLDFAKNKISVEVAFNHQEAVAHNLIKPVLASELNHVEKAIQTNLGVIITATDALKVAGGFDGSIGTFEKFLSFLKPYNNFITVPLIIIGLEPPESFEIKDKEIYHNI